MHVYHWQFRASVRFEECFVAVVQTVVGAEEVDCSRGQIHDEVGDCLRDGEGLGRSGGSVGFAAVDAFWWDGDGVLVGGC